MPYRLTITATDMREINRSAILEIIRRESPISRSAIARQLNVSLPTVMRIVDELLAEGFVHPEGSSEWSGGRRRPLLEFNTSGFVVIGVDMGGTKFYGALSDLGGNILDEIDMGRHRTTAEGNYERLLELIDALLASPHLAGRKVRGIGVGAPGITLHSAGIVKWAYTLNWRDFPLKARLVQHYGLPITVDNDVNLAAMGELWFGAGQNVQNMILVSNGKGIGAGIVIDGALYRGASEASGEIGNFIPGREFLGKNYQAFGALESVASGTGMLERARSLLAGAAQNGAAALTEDDLLQAARQGQPWAVTVMQETADYLAIAIANLTSSFDPELIVLGGSLPLFAESLVQPILRRMESVLPALPKLVVSDLGLRAGVMGAVINVLHNTSNFYVVHKLS
jgi:predicted NBD/HSP70 family sugar kinase